MTTNAWRVAFKIALMLSPTIIAAPADAASYCGTIVGNGGTLGAGGAPTYTYTQAGYVYAYYVNGSLVGPPDPLDPALDGYIPAATLHPGDQVSAFLELSAPLTVAGTGRSNFLYLYFQQAQSPSQTIYYNENVTYYSNGVEVAPPASWTPLTSSDGSLSLGEQWTGRAAPFSFDQMLINATIDSPDSVNLLTTIPDLEQLSVSPVPLPAGVWLMLSGLGGLGAMLRRRKSC